MHIQPSNPFVDLIRCSPPCRRLTEPTRRGGTLVKTESGVRARSDNPRSRGPAPDFRRAQLPPRKNRQPRPTRHRQHFMDPRWTQSMQTLVMKGSSVRVRASASRGLHASSTKTPCKTTFWWIRKRGVEQGQERLFGYRRGTPESRVAHLTEVSGQADAVGRRGTGCSCCADRTTRDGAASRRSFPGSEASSCDRLGQPVAVRHASLLRSGVGESRCGRSAHRSVPLFRLPTARDPPPTTGLLNEKDRVPTMGGTLSGRRSRVRVPWLR